MDTHLFFLSVLIGAAVVAVVWMRSGSVLGEKPDNYPMIGFGVLLALAALHVTLLFNIPDDYERESSENLWQGLAGPVTLDVLFGLAVSLFGAAAALVSNFVNGVGSSQRVRFRAALSYLILGCAVVGTVSVGLSTMGVFILTRL